MMMNGQAGRMVVGFDGSDHSVVALAWAAREAAQRGLPLTVMHVADYQDGGRTPTALWPQLHEEAQKVANAGMERARRLSGSSDITAVARAGQVNATLIETSREAVLLVVVRTVAVEDRISEPILTPSLDPAPVTG
jgi:nucleotide-binding universal stress UspA family protein